MRSNLRLSLPFLSIFLALFCTGSLFAAQEAQAKQSQTPSKKGPLTPEEIRQNEQRAQIVINQSEEHYKKGEELFKRGVINGAQAEFEAALKVIDDLDEDMRNNALVEEYYGKLLEKINSHDAATTAPAPPETQKYEKSELDELSNIDLDKEQLKARAMTVKPGQYDFDFEITPPVEQFIAYFTEGRGRATMQHGLERSGRFRKMAEKIFKEEGVPVDMIWLAQVESVWKPLAVSSASAKGVWQFMPFTGLQYGLNQDAWIDERSNPEKETRAAARYLRYLADYFAGDWLLAMAAYNSGPGRVESGIARCGYADFWEIHKRGLLLKETQNYVPAILASIVVAKNAKSFGFEVTPDPAMSFDTYDLPAQTDLRVVADLLGMSVDSIQEYNPELRRLVTPPGQYTLKLPKGTVEKFTVAYAALPPEKRLRQDIIIPYPNYNSRSVAVRASYTTHRVVRGETLGRIAGRAGLSQKELARINGLRPNTQLHAGQTIRVPRRGPGYRTHAISRRGHGRGSARRGHAARRRR